MIDKCKLNKEDKEFLIKLVDREIGYAADNLYRAKITFKGHNLDEYYGESGETKGEILNSYKIMHNKAVMVKKSLIE